LNIKAKKILKTTLKTTIIKIIHSKMKPDRHLKAKVRAYSVDYLGIKIKSR